MILYNIRTRHKANKNDWTIRTEITEHNLCFNMLICTVVYVTLMSDKIYFCYFYLINWKKNIKQHVVGIVLKPNRISQKEAKSIPPTL